MADKVQQPPAITQQLIIRFRGICALIDLPDKNAREQKSKRKRAVLLRHRGGDDRIEHHIPYIEFFADDVAKYPRDLEIRQYTRPGFDGRLARIDLDETAEIVLKAPERIPAGDVEEEPNYAYDVPHMKEILRTFKSVADDVVPSMLVEDATKIDRDRTSAVFDMPAGRIMAGEPESMITRFEKRVKFTPRRLARWTDLLISLAPPLTLELHTLGADVSREIVFHDTLRMLTIGNEPERIILGILTSDTAVHGVNHAHPESPDAAPVQPTGHYILYYDLLTNRPADPPVPIPTQYTTPGCPPNGYP